MQKKHPFASLAAVLLLAGCGTGPATDSPAPAAAAAVAVDASLPVQEGTPFGAVLWLHPADPARNLVVGAAGTAGLTLHTATGESRGGFAAILADAIAITWGFDAGAGPGPLLIAHDRAAAALRAFGIDPGSMQLRELTAAPLALGDELTGLCAYRSPLSGKSYALAATDRGDLQQWELYAKDGAVRGRLVRSIPVGFGAGHCVADDPEGVVYVADEAVGIWRIAAEPEADPARELLDLTAPRGALGEEVKGLALHRAQGATTLLAVDEDEAAVHAYALPGGGHIGRFTLAGAEGVQFESLWAGGDSVLVADEGGGAFRALRWDAIAPALKLPAAAPLDPRAIPAPAARIVEPTVETEPVLDYGDAADDPAIWVHPANPARSLIVGAQKKRGVEVYDLAGRRVQLLPVGYVNNVDLRQGVPLGGRKRDVVAGSNRTSKTLDLFEMNPATGRLADVAAAPVPTGMRDPYGLCMYHSAKSGKLYVFVNNSDAGEFRQWEIGAEGAKLTATPVREFTVGSQAEGCAADDETGALYIAEEDVGLWRYSAEPDGGGDRRPVDTTADGGHLKADVEGVSIFRAPGGAGWLIVSNQGADNYAVYRREGDNAFVGHFSIVANDELGIDGASETDGLDVTSAPLGSAFPRGLLVVQDGRNITPAERQNFKLVPWERIAAALGL